MLILIIIILTAVIFIYEALIWGWVLFKFWEWFVLPVFSNLPVLTLGQAIGLIFVIGLFKPMTTEIIKKEYKESWGHWLVLAYPWITLILGWLAWKIFL